MQRNEFEVLDESAIVACLNESEYGVLSLMSDQEPYGVALNFVYEEGVVYFHGSKEGKKAEAIDSHPRASFLVVKPYAYIPSYFFNTTLASPATQFFASVHFFGEIHRIDSMEEKAKALSALMQKYQKEGGYDPVSAKDPRYKNVIEKTAIFALSPHTCSMKVKVGQNLPKERQEHVIQQLQERNAPNDLDTIVVMRKITDERI